MTPLVAVALAGWLLILIGGALYAARAVQQNRRAARDWRPGQGQEDEQP